MSDLPTYHKGKRNFGTGYDMMDRIEALEAEAEGAHAVIATERAEVIKLRKENERLLEAFCVNMLCHGYDHADIDDVLSACYALKGDSND